MTWIDKKQAATLASRFSGISFTLNDSGLAYMLGVAPRVTAYWASRAIGRSFQGHWNAVRSRHSGKKIQQMFMRSWRYTGWPPPKNPEAILHADNNAWKRVAFHGYVRSLAAVGLEFGETIRAKSGGYLAIPAHGLRIFKSTARSLAKNQAGVLKRFGASGPDDQVVLRKRAGFMVFQKDKDGKLIPLALLRSQVKLPEKLKLREVWNSLAQKREQYVAWAAENIAKSIAGNRTESQQVNALIQQGAQRKRAN